MDTPIPICLVTGFLGSGKTTFLKSVVKRHRDRALVYLVNEFSPRDIDGAIVSRENPSVVAIPGGSIFCKCLVTEFISQLTAIPKTFSGVDGVVIEASGMANPKVMADMLRETGMNMSYRLAHIVSIVDPGSFLKLRATLPNITAQVEAADTVLINKTDLHGAEAVSETIAELQAIKPTVEIRKCRHADAPIDLFAPPAPRDALHGDYAKCKDPNYDTVTVAPRTNIDVGLLRDRLLAVQDDVYRMKGDIRTTSGTLHVEYTKSGFTSEPATDIEDPALVVITRGSPTPDTQDFLTWLVEAENPAT
jgi:G3E family GTPase